MARSLPQEAIDFLQSYLDDPNSPEGFRQSFANTLFNYHYFPKADATNVNDMMKFASQYNVELTPYQEKYLDNLLSQYNAQHDILNQAGQLQSLGLSAANVSPAGMGRASNTTENMANAREQRRVQEASNRIGLAKAFLGLAGGLGAAGIYGHAREVVRQSATKMASLSASSALHLNPYDRYR